MPPQVHQSTPLEISQRRNSLFDRNLCSTGRSMKRIEIRAENWRGVLDFYTALLAALEAPPGHGRNINALVDSMVWGGMNELEPPYAIPIVGSSTLPTAIRQERVGKQVYSGGSRGLP